MKKKTPPSDDYQIRCPRLGHQIYFSYCHIENQGSPCFKILDCWHTHFDVEGHLKTRLSKDEWEKVFTRQTKPKMLTLLELIEQAKKNRKE